MNFLRNFMVGRYGPDNLNVAIFIAALVLSFLSRIPHLWLLMYVSYAVLAYGIFRFLSRNVRKRRSENDRFLRYWWPVRQKGLAIISSLKSRKTHKFFNCPSCGTLLRVPRGKGKMQITCTKCGERFVRKT